MTLQDEKKIREWYASIEYPIEIKYFQTRTSQDKTFTQFCRMLADCAPRVSVKTVTDTFLSVPEIRISEQICYQAVPEGPELEPFLFALEKEGPYLSIPPIPNAIQLLPDLISPPVFLKLYISPLCPFCPSVVRQLIMLARTVNYIRVSVIDGTLFPKLAQMDGIQSAPTLLFGLFRWTGQVPMEEVIKAIAEKDPANLSSETLANIIHDGAADKVAGMMLKTRMIFPSFISLLCHEKWPVRLGAMVVMETIIEADVNFACQAVMPLCEVIESLNDTVKGDVLYVLGEIGDPGALPVIYDIQKRVLNDEVRAAAAEAIEKILIATD